MLNLLQQDLLLPDQFVHFSLGRVGCGDVHDRQQQPRGHGVSKRQTLGVEAQAARGCALNGHLQLIVGDLSVARADGAQ
ncbi:hypothetical protein D3C87_1651540 [compost metagenome]